MNYAKADGNESIANRLFEKKCKLFNIYLGEEAEKYDQYVISLQECDWIPTYAYTLPTLETSEGTTTTFGRIAL